MADACLAKQIYFGFDLWQAIFLVGSNLILIPVIFRAWKFAFYTRSFLYTAAFTASFLYHICIVQGLGGASCVFGFCYLKLLDYTGSYTVLFASFLLFLPFTSIHEKPKDNEELPVYNRRANRRKIKPNTTFAEDWIIYSIAITVAIMVGIVNNFEALTWLQIVLVLIPILVIVTMGWVHLYVVLHQKPEFDVIDLIISIVLALIGVFFFFVEYRLSPGTYWITHSLWHIFAGLSQLYLLESRNKKRSGCWVLLPN